MSDFQTVELIDENGNPCRFTFLDAISLRGGTFVVLLSEEAGSEAVVLQAVIDGEDEYYASVDDEETLKEILRTISQRLKESVKLG